MGKHILFLGFGFCAEALVARLRATSQNGDWQFSATCRTPQKAQHLQAMGIRPILWSGQGCVPQDIKQAISHVLVSAPPTDSGDVFVPLMRDDYYATFGHKLSDIVWLGYLSTTGVYGDQQGRVVDESTPPTPTSPRGQRRYDSECAWARWGARAGVAVHIFRLAGIYGAHRNQLTSLKAGKARRIYKAGQVFSRIHVADIAQTLCASINTPTNVSNGGQCYNVCDDLPAPPQDVVAYAAELLGVAPPPLIDFAAADLSADLSEMTRSFYAENKRPCNRRIKQELGVRLAYPTYREGLRALFAAGEF